jgi:hypothetical protein
MAVWLVAGHRAQGLKSPAESEKAPSGAGMSATETASHAFGVRQRLPVGGRGCRNGNIRAK